jgi:hypothetical protein
MKKEKLFTMMLLISNSCLYSQIHFSEQTIISHADVDGPESVIAADLDGDGDLDVLSASTSDDKVAWYENTDGKGTFGPQRVIAQSADSPKSVFAADLDGDGDTDVLSASISDDKIAWYENADGNGTFAAQRVISSAAHGAVSVFAADLDGDGDMDVLAALYSDNAIAWYENTDGHGNFGSQQVFTTQASLISCICGSDLDGDGDVDVLSASTQDDKIAWYENADGKGTFSPQQVISTTADMAIFVYAVDIDGDGDMDVLSASSQDDKIAWYENIDGKGAFSPQKVITRDADAAWSVSAADLDTDGDMDVLSASAGDDKIAYYENVDGQGTFGPQQIITEKADQARSVYAADLDGDGRADVLSASQKDDKIAWFRNRQETLWDRLVEHLIDPDFNGNISIYSADIDSDGDHDLIAAGDGIAYFENLEDASGSFLKHGVVDGSYVVSLVDMDGDNDMDILGGRYKDILWWENAGSGIFTAHLIDNSTFQSVSVNAVDLDSDGDIDVISASNVNRAIGWWENDGSENFAKKTIAQGGFKSIYSIDVDCDGDMDIPCVQASSISWLENDGLQNFSNHVIADKLHFMVFVFAIDLDNDADVDILGVDKYAHQVILWENDGLQNFTTVVIDSGIVWPELVDVADLDNDGDLDLLAVASNDDYLCVYENLGSKKFYKQIIRKNFDGASCVHAVDIDNDGDLDIVAAASDAHDVIWWENPLLTNPDLKKPDIAVLPDTLFFYWGPDTQVNAIICSIKNIGNGILQVQNISSETDWIISIDTVNFFLKPGGERDVTVGCSAEGLFNGVYKGALVIHSNDPDTPVFNLPLVLEMKKGQDVNFVDESEPNNTSEFAQKLIGPSPSGIKGSISVMDVGDRKILDDDIEDLYLFTIRSRGIKLKLYDQTADLDMSLLKIDGNTMTIWGANHRGSTRAEEFEKADLEPGTYYVGVSIYDPYPIADSSGYSLAVVGDIVTAVRKLENVMLREYSLQQNYPNPFNSCTVIKYQLPQVTDVILTVYNLAGTQIRKFVQKQMAVGYHEIIWDGRDETNRPVPSGIYWIEMKAASFNKQSKMTLIK